MGEESEAAEYATQQQSALPVPNDEVAHAIRDYRARGANRPHKLAALALLAGELENRRSNLKKHLLTKDESSLFQIANQYAVRHRDAAQKRDYEIEFLDWIFGLFVTTINLLDRIDKRPSSTTADPDENSLSHPPPP